MKHNATVFMMALSMVVISCNKEQPIKEDISGKETTQLITEVVGAGLDITETKAVINDGLKFSWRDGSDRAGDYVAFWNGSTFVRSSASAAAAASTTFTLNYTGTRSEYAYYPYYIVQDIETAVDGTGMLSGAGTTTIVLPSTYDYAEVSGTNTPCPMIAANAPESGWAFKQLCGLLRLTVPGIPATADEMVITFDKVVTGAFAVTGADTTTPYITAGNGTSSVSITLTPGADYCGAVVNIPVPQGNISVTSVKAKVGGEVLATSITSPILSGWNVARKHGKKATAAFTPSFGSVIIAPGNLYTESGTLKMASNYYDHVYASSATQIEFKEDNYDATNRTHFNFNEAYHLMHGTAPSELTFALATTDEIGDRDPVWKKSNIVGGDSKAWYIPDYYDLWQITGLEVGKALKQIRPGAKVRNGDSGEYTSGWMWVKVLVNGMEGKGTSSADGTTALAGDATGPSTNYQAGLLLFPDNMEITGTFGTLGMQNSVSSLFSTTTITKGNIDALITAGCAFLPAAGRYSTTYDNWSGVGTAGSLFNCYRINYIPWSYYINFDNSNFTFADSNIKATTFRNVRLVRSLN